MTNSIDKIASVLEDISIKPEVEADDEFKLKSESNEPLSPIDDKTIKLLELVDSYEKLSNENRLNYINGFLNLSRANYNTGSLRKKYGPESFDLRPYEACKSIQYDKTFQIIDKLKKQTKDNEKLEKGETQDKEESSLKNRRTKKSAVEIKKSDIDEIAVPKLKDPISQFGGLVPYQLRQSQKYFDDCLTVSVKLVNLQREIIALIEDIEELSK